LRITTATLEPADAERLVAAIAGLAAGPAATYQG
jgi:hypothetical protein